MSTPERIVDPDTGKIDDSKQDDVTTDINNTPEIPEKFRNKSLDDVIQSYTELEKAYGRQSNEFGELRKLTDSILLKQLEESNQEDNEQPQHEAVEFEDFVQDPEGSVGKVVSRHLKKVEDKLSEMDKADRFTKFERKHPDWQKHLSTEDFQEWIKGSSYRTNLYQRADSYDIDAADELFSTWKERQDFLSAQKEKEEKDNKAAIESDFKRASSETGSTGQSPGKTFRRADIIRMRAYEPEKYAEMQEEIRDAYMNGRVK